MQVDQRHEAILVPIYGVMVPFHILTLKNATVNQDGSVAFVRLNFNFGGPLSGGSTTFQLHVCIFLIFNNCVASHCVRSFFQLPMSSFA